jgi:hypothetical protein
MKHRSTSPNEVRDRLLGVLDRPFAGEKLFDAVPDIVLS